MLRRLTSLLIVILAIHCLATSCTPGGPPPSDPSPEPDATVLTEGGPPIEREISSGEKHRYKIPMRDGWFGQLRLEQRGASLAASLADTSGGKVLEVKGLESGPTPISWISDSGGAYLLELRSSDAFPEAGYRISLSQARPRQPADSRRIEAERAQARAERLHFGWRAGSVAVAVALYRRAIEGWAETGETRLQAAALKQLALLHHARGKPREALPLLERALALSRGCGDRRGEGEVLAALCAISGEFGDRHKALQECADALEISRDAGGPQLAGSALNHLGILHADNPAEAARYFERAETAWRQAGNRRGLAETLLNRCHNSIAISDVAAGAVCDEALDLWRTIKDPRGEALTLTAVGHLNVRNGNWQAGIDRYEEARRLFGQIGQKSSQASLLNGLGYIYQETDQFEKALLYHQEALDLFEQIDDQAGFGDTLLYLGRAHAAAGDLERAALCQNRALGVFQSTGDRRMQAYPHAYLGEIRESQRDDAAALDHLNKALALMREGQDEYNQANVINRIARIEAKQGRRGPALRLLEEALALNRRTGNQAGEILTLANMARLEGEGLNLAKARTLMEQALQKIENLRSRIAGLELRASYFATVRDLYDYQIDLLMRLHQRRPKGNLDRLAFELSERSRARTLMETLTEARDQSERGVEPRLLRRQEELRGQIERLASPEKRAGRAADGEVGRLLTEYEEVRAQIRRQSPLYDPVRQPKALALEELRSGLLDADTLLLEYSLGNRRSFLWAVTSKGLSSHELPPRTVVNEAARRVFDLITARQPLPDETLERYQLRVRESDSRCGKEIFALSRMVLGPVADQLLNAKRLIVVSEGALLYLPFAALPHPSKSGDGGGGGSGTGDADLQPLVETHEIVHLPSASTLAALRALGAGSRTFPGTVAVVADPVFEGDDPRLETVRAKEESLPAGRADATSASSPVTDSDLRRALRDVPLARDGVAIPRLLFAGQEAQAIMSVAPTGTAFRALGLDANRSVATSSDLGRYRIVHFATHGLLNNDHPELSGLLLSFFDKHGRPVNGFLRLDEIYSLELPVDLVVLSACNTGLGKEVRGEGLVGLARGFMYAGSNRVMASLWRVDDEATGELMKRFYRHLLQSKMPPPAALREAQRELRRETRWKRPFHWAAFVVLGDFR